MKIRNLFLLFVSIVLLFSVAFAEEEPAVSDFRSMPGYTCFPLSTDNDEYPGHFVIDCPMEWEGGDYSEAYGVPQVIAVDPENQNHLVLVAEISMMDQALILVDDSHPLAGFLDEGLQVLQGKSTETSLILEQSDLHGLPATRVEMVSQGFEMIWIVDPDENIRQSNDMGVAGDLWFFMYPTDPDDTEYTRTVSAIVDSFTVSGVYNFGPWSLEYADASEFSYTVDGDEVCINSYLGSREYVKVPDEIEEKPVTALGDGVFFETSVRYVDLPDSIRTMGSHTFGGCPYLCYAGMPESLEVLPEGTFESCFRLVDPGLNEGLKKIEQAAFWGNRYLNTLNLPASLEEIEDGAFVMCDYLGYIVVPESSSFFRGNEKDTVLFSADGEKLIWYSFMNDEKEYQVPDGVKQICANAFQRAPLASVTLPDGLEYIGYGAFVNTGITELHIPESVTEIGVMQNVLVNDNPERQTVAFLSIGDSLKTICGVPGSAAEKYAETQNLPFVPEE